MKPERLIPAPPISPGDVLRKYILSNKDVTQDSLATAMQVSRFSINQIVTGKRSITAEMALKLARVTSTTAEFWLNLQLDMDLYRARLKLSEELPRLPVLRPPKTEDELFVYVPDEDGTMSARNGESS
jgi:addiction module HigA family antidote